MIITNIHKTFHISSECMFFDAYRNILIKKQHFGKYFTEDILPVGLNISFQIFSKSVADIFLTLKRNLENKANLLQEIFPYKFFFLLVLTIPFRVFFKNYYVE